MENDQRCAPVSMDKATMLTIVQVQLYWDLQDSDWGHTVTPHDQAYQTLVHTCSDNKSHNKRTLHAVQAYTCCAI